MARAEIVETLTCTCEKRRRVMVIALLKYYRVKAEYTTWYNETVGKRIFLLIFLSSIRALLYSITTTTYNKVLRELTPIICCFYLRSCNGSTYSNEGNLEDMGRTTKRFLLHVLLGYVQ